ncbi:hypothetical protein EBS43_00245 [bacterium]|jgi:hypothetical protein|nr:hypothetical protein [bacterium]
MFLFGHLGIGSEIIRPFSRGLSLKWILLGTLLPDLIDKPIYYGLKLVTGHAGSDLFLVHGTRSFGHTGVFTVSLGLLAFRTRSKKLAALTLGSLSHLLLDAFSFYLPHYLEGEGNLGEIFSAIPILWPLRGWEFPITPFYTLVDQLSQVSSPLILVFESIGALILFLRSKLAMRALRRLTHIKPHR